MNNLFITCSYQFHFLFKHLISLFLYKDIKKEKKKGKKRNNRILLFKFQLQLQYTQFYFVIISNAGFKPEFLQPFLCMENSCLLVVNIEKSGNTVGYYIVKTFLDPTHYFRFRYTKISCLSIMYEKQDMQLIKQISNEQAKKKSYNYVYNIAIFLCIAVDYKGQLHR